MKTLLKRAGLVLAGLIVAVLIAVGALYVSLQRQLDRTYDIKPAGLQVPEPDSALLARGSYVAQTRHCTGCHTDDLGGTVMADDAIFGLIASANLTAGRGGIGAEYSEDDWVRAIRHGVGRDRKPLMIMPADEFADIAREDLVALIAYLEELPPVDRERPSRKIGLLLPTMTWLNGFEPVKAGLIDHDSAIPSRPAMAITPEYGEYVAGACRGCHGADMAGQEMWGTRSANLTMLRDWTEANFTRAVRDGIRPTGDTLLPAMPRWSILTDVEMRAIWAYVEGLEPRPSDG